MRYFLQAVVMLSDLVVAFAIMYVLYTAPSVGTVVICALAVWAWRKNGGIFYAWRPANFHAFLKNAKKMGL